MFLRSVGPAGACNPSAQDGDQSTVSPEGLGHYEIKFALHPENGRAGYRLEECACVRAAGLSKNV